MRRVVRHLLFPALPVAALALATPASVAALTIRVHPDSVGVANHVATILEANAMAAFGDSIEVSSAGSPYIHTDAMTMFDGVVYRGGFGPDFEGPDPDLYETVIELQPGPGLFPSVLDAAATGSTTLLEGFTVTGGNSSFSAGGIYCGDLTVRDCRFTGNHATVVGGGIQIPGGSDATIYDCVIDNCTAGQRGGGIAVTVGAGAARIEKCRIESCSADPAGAFGAGGGGGVFLASGVEFVRNTVQSCSTGTFGGAILTRNASGIDFLTNYLFDNRAALDGGGLYMDGGDGVYQGFQIERCTSGRDGGAAFFKSSTVTVRRSFVRDCTAFARGGGFCIDGNTGSLVMTTEFVGNHAATGGGMELSGLPFRSTSVEVRNNTFALNGASVAAAGGGMHFAGPGFFDVVVNNIVAYQSDGAGIGAVGINNQPTLLNNCVYNDDATNTDAEYGGIPDRSGTQGNFRGVPRFCGLTEMPPQLGLDLFSPCLASGHDGEDVGAHQGADCEVTVSLEPTTWSRIKSYYR
jgi:Right handed beta helix region